MDIAVAQNQSWCCCGPVIRRELALSTVFVVVMPCQCDDYGLLHSTNKVAVYYSLGVGTSVNDKYTSESTIFELGKRAGITVRVKRVIDVPLICPRHIFRGQRRACNLSINSWACYIQSVLTTWSKSIVEYDNVTSRLDGGV